MRYTGCKTLTIHSLLQNIHQQILCPHSSPTNILVHATPKEIMEEHAILTLCISSITLHNHFDLHEKEYVLYDLPLLRKRNGKRISLRRNHPRVEALQAEAMGLVDQQEAGRHIGQ